VHMLRCQNISQCAARPEVHHPLLFFWISLLVFITYRMGTVLAVL